MKTPVLLGVDIGGTNTKIALVGARGRSLASVMVPTRPREGGEALFLRVRELIPDLTGTRREITAVGVGCAGLVDRNRGRVHSSPNLPGWENTPIARIGRRVFGVYTYVDNDANAAAWGEYKRGCGMRSKMFVCLTLGTGVGGGIIDRGRVVRGAKNFAGEIGHLSIAERGPVCKCGNQGCLEAFVSADALVANAKRLLRRQGGRLRGKIGSLGDPLTPERLASAARAGDPVAREVFETAGRHLGVALASIVNVLNPDTIGVAGGVASNFDLMKKTLRETVNNRAFPESAAAVDISAGRIGVYAAAIGVALMTRDGLR